MDGSQDSTLQIYLHSTLFAETYNYVLKSQYCNTLQLLYDKSNLGGSSFFPCVYSPWKEPCQQQNTKNVSLIYCVKLSFRKKGASSPIGQCRLICSLGFNFRVCSERLSYPIIFQQRSKYSHPFFSAVPSYYRMKSYNS